MQWLAEICVKRPVFTWVLTLALVVVGWASVGGLGVDRFPNIDFPVVVVTTQLPGASPEQVETEVTEPIEEQLNSIAGLDELTSNSFEGLSVVAARFSLEKPLSDASEEVRDRLQRALQELPEGAEQPIVQRVDPDAAPVMEIAVISNRSSREVTDFADRVIRRRIESMSGVGGVTITGGQEREVHVILDPASLTSLGLTARDVQRALAAENVEVPGGDVEQGTRTIQLRVQGRIRNPEDFALIPVASRSGRIVRVGDVARVVDAEEDPVSAATLNGEDVVILSVRKQSGANTVAVVDALTERVQEIQQDLPPSYRLSIVRDESEFIRNSIHAVEEHLVLGGLLAALVVLFFLGNGRSTIITALAIPTSIIATFAFVSAMGLTLNMITLLGLTLSVGIVIDDAIVVLENIVRYIEEKHYSPRRAAIYATKEIGLAVLATSLSLVAVFLPVAFMGGIVGRFMSSFGYVMSFAIMVSLFVSFTLTPSLASRWLRPVKSDKPEPEGEEHSIERFDPPPGKRKIERQEYLQWIRGERTLEVAESGHHASTGPYRWLERGYMILLAFCMRYTWLVGLAIIGSMVAVVPLFQMAPKNFLPEEDESRFEVTLRLPEGTSLAQTQVESERIARAIRERSEVESTVLTVGSPPGDPSGRGANEASLYVGLVSTSERETSQEEVITWVRENVLAQYAERGYKTLVGPVNAFGGSGASAAAIQYVLSGPDLDRLEEYASRMLEQVRQIPGIGESDMTLVTGRPTYEIHVDRRRAADLNVSVADISTAMRISVGGLTVTDFSEAGEQYDVVLRAESSWRSQTSDIAQIPVPTQTGGTVRLSDVATIEQGTGPAAISHLGRQRQVTIYASTRPGASEAAITTEMDRIRESLDMESGYRAALTGRSREMGRAASSFLFAVGLCFMFMYLVLAAQFESWVHPVTILASLPLTLPFALLSIVIFGQSLNIYSMLGLLVLFGVVKKNSILQIDHIRELRRNGLSRPDAVMVGNRDRLRPILMTTIAFVAGMIPLIVSSGAGSGTNRAIGGVIVGGQTLSLLLTLIATPVLYVWLDNLSHWWVIDWVRGAILAPLNLLDSLIGRISGTQHHDSSSHSSEPAAISEEE